MSGRDLRRLAKSKNNVVTLSAQAAPGFNKLNPTSANPIGQAAGEYYYQVNSSWLFV